jgi:hypothetical protein
MTLYDLAFPAFHAVMAKNKTVMPSWMPDVSHGSDSALFLKGIQRNRFFQKNENLLHNKAFPGEIIL